LDNVREQLIDCMNEKLELQKEVRSLGSELSVHKCKLEVIKNEQNKGEILLKNAEDKIGYLKKDLQQRTVETEREAQENNSLRDKMRMLEDLIRELEHNEENLQRKLKEKELKLTTMQSYYKSPATKASNLPTETKQLRDQLKTWMSTKDSNLQKALEQVSTLDKERQTLLKDLSKARVEIEKLKGGTQKGEKLALLDAKIQTTTSEIDYREFLRKLLKPEFESLKRVVLESRQNGIKEADSDLPDLKDALVIDRMTAEENLGVSGRWKQQYEAATREVKNTKAKLEETKKIVQVREKEFKREQILSREHMARSKALLLKKKNELELASKEISDLKARELSLSKCLADVTQKLRSEQEQFEKGKANVKQYEADMAALVKESISLKLHTERSVRTCKEIKQRWIDELCGHTQDINRLKEVEKELKEHTEKIDSFQDPGEQDATKWKAKCEELEIENKRLRTNLDDLQSKIDSKHEEWTDLHKAFTNVQELYKESKRDRDRHQELTSAQTAGSNTTSEVLNDGTSTTLQKEWKKKISDLEDRLRAKTREVVESNEKVSIMEGKLSNNRLMIQKQLNLQKVQELEMQDIKEMQQKVKRIGIIESSNLELREKSELLEETLARERTNRNELKKQIVTLKAANVKMNTERSGLLVKMEQLQEEIRIFESRNEVMVKKYHQIDPAIYQSMRTTIKDLRRKLTELSAANTKDLNTKDSEIKTFRDEQKCHKEIIRRLETNITGLDSKLKERFSKHAASKSRISNKKLSADLLTLRGALGKAQNQIRKVTVKQGPHMEVLLKRNNELIDVVSQARHIILKLESDLERLQGGGQDSGGRQSKIEGVEQLSESLESWRKQAIQSRITFKKLTAEVERLKKEIQSAKERIESLVEDLKNAEATGDAVRIQLAATQKEAEGERLRGNTLLLRVKNLEKKLACLDSEKEELRRDMQLEITTLQEQQKELVVRQGDSQTLIAKFKQERDKLLETLSKKEEELRTQEQGGENHVNEDIEQAKEDGEENANEEDEVAKTVSSKNITHHKRTREEAFHLDDTVDVGEMKNPPAKKIRIGDVPEDDYMQEDVHDEEEDDEDESGSDQEQEDDNPASENDEVVEESMIGQNELTKENEEFVDVDFVEQKEDAVDSLEPYLSREPSASMQPLNRAGEQNEDAIAETESEEIEENAQGDDSEAERIIGEPVSETPASKSQSLVAADTEELVRSAEQEEDQAADQPHISEPEDPEDVPSTLVSTQAPREIEKTPIDEEEEVQDEEPESADSQAESEEGSEIEEDRTEMEDGGDDEDFGEERGQPEPQ